MRPRDQSRKIGQISWKLKDLRTDQVFAARQTANLCGEAVQTTLLSDQKLTFGHTYATLEISARSAKSIPLQTPERTGFPRKPDHGVVKGTHIMTERGEVLIEDLTAEIKVVTRNHGLQPICWVGSTKVKITSENAPILFRRNAIRNSRDLMVCPQHQIVQKGALPMMLFGELEVLRPANHFVGVGISIRSEFSEIEFFRILTARPELIYAEAAACVSFIPSPLNLSALKDEDQARIHRRFPQLTANSLTHGPQTYSAIDPAIH